MGRDEGMVVKIVLVSDQIKKGNPSSLPPSKREQESIGLVGWQSTGCFASNLILIDGCGNGVSSIERA